MKRVGVLALQGDVSEHVTALEAVGVLTSPVTRSEHLSELDGLVIPGGESTAIRKLMQRHGLFEAVRAFADSGRGLWGTCAGLVLLAERIEGGEEGLGLMDYTAVRNGFGRQYDSFEENLKIPVLGKDPFCAVFIRAPYIADPGSQVEVLAKSGKHIVAARQGKRLATAFHPEIADDCRFHRFFVGNCL